LNSFNDFGLAEPILRALAEEKYVTPTPIQDQTIPLLLAKRDVVGIAQTGTGKTAAFALPILNTLAANRVRPQPKTCRVLVLSPTREPSGQILDSFRTYGRHLRIQSTLAIGGVNMGPQVRALAHGVDVLVATPGRLLDLMQSQAVKLDRVEVLVLDEADRMLDMGFAPQINQILDALPVERQTLLFSATLPASLVEFAKAGLQDPLLIRLDVESKISEDLETAFFTIKPVEKEAGLLYLLQEVIKVPVASSKAATAMRRTVRRWLGMLSRSRQQERAAPARSAARSDDVNGPRTRCDRWRRRNRRTPAATRPGAVRRRRAGRDIRRSR
jgi:ATP-dependent RNA helicase RhlE